MCTMCFDHVHSLIFHVIHPRYTSTSSQPHILLLKIELSKSTLCRQQLMTVGPSLEHVNSAWAAPFKKTHSPCCRSH